MLQQSRFLTDLNEWDPQEQCKVGGAGKGENLWTEHEVRCRPGPKHHDLEDSKHAGSWRKPAGKGRGYHAKNKTGDMPLGAMCEPWKPKEPRKGAHTRI